MQNNLILHLNLKRKWFDRHLKDKEDEYREITTYWCARLLLVDGKRHKQTWWEKREKEYNGNLHRFLMEESGIKKEKYTSIIFSNGMKPISMLPRFSKKLVQLQIGLGQKEWGAPGYPVFILKCGVAKDIVNL